MNKDFGVVSLKLDLSEPTKVQELSRKVVQKEKNSSMGETL